MINRLNYSRPQLKSVLWLPILLLAFALLLGSSRHHSLTVDELGHLFRGVAYLRTGATHFRWGHPLFAGTLTALPLLTEPDLQLPPGLLAWQQPHWEQLADDFLWENNAHPHRLIFLGRLSTIWITLLLGALVHRWAKQLWRGAANLALALFLFDPNLLAHGQLMTSDLMVTATMFGAIYSFWRWQLTEKWQVLGLCGIAIGVTITTKFNGFVVVPAVSLFLCHAAYRQKSWQPIKHLFFLGLIAFLTSLLIYRFHLAPLGQELWQELHYLRQPHPAYLLGQYSLTGWWYYFPIAFLVKTPPLTLFLLGWAILQMVHRHFAANFYLLLLPALYFALAIFSPLNIGYRHLLPILPFIAVWLVQPLQHRSVGINAGILASVALALFTYPHYLAYFNLLAGKAESRWQILSDSNIDWGQDLPALAQWQQSHLDQPLYLSYFGIAPPAAYNVHAQLLPSWLNLSDNPTIPFDPTQPPPGYYAITVTNLHGTWLGEQRHLFALFRHQKPLARLGGSIFIYQVLPEKMPAFAPPPPHP